MTTVERGYAGDGIQADLNRLNTWLRDERVTLFQLDRRLVRELVRLATLALLDQPERCRTIAR